MSESAQGQSQIDRALGYVRMCQQAVATSLNVLEMTRQQAAAAAEVAKSSLDELKGDSADGAALIVTFEAKPILDKGAKAAEDAGRMAQMCTEHAAGFIREMPEVPSSCFQIPKPLKAPLPPDYSTKVQIVRNEAFQIFGQADQFFARTQKQFEAIKVSCDNSLLIAQSTGPAFRQATLANQNATRANGDGGGPIHTQPVEKKPNKLMNAAKQAGPGVLGALMAGAGALAGKGGGNEASPPKPQQPAPQQQTPDAKPIADAKPPAKDSDVDAMKAETEKTATPLGGGSRDLTTQDPLVKLTSEKVKVTEVKNPDGSVKVVKEIDGHEKAEKAPEETAKGDGTLDSDQETVGAAQGAETGAQLASGSTSSGRALAGDSSGASGGYLGSGGYVGTGRSHSYGGGGEAGAGGAAPAVDSNYIGAGYAGEADSGAGVQSVPGRRRRRAALPICGPNSKANGVACQEIQKLRDDRAERKKGVINTDEYLNIAPASTRKR